ncbi:2'-5' RNA ligase family protein [Clostridium sp. BJN0013]|uniref:2'-5' RNA ligase family protein n=1 Tax=Clostridium sp. BJN0013 TaxID=3236840 RepID=UPI0034C677E8
MKYYLVALFDRDSYFYIQRIQKNVCRKYKLYKNIPMLHINLEVIENPDLEKLIKVVSDILKPYKKFKVQINDASIDSLYKSINLKIANKGYIIRLARQINEILRLHRFNVKENLNNIDLKVLLANTNYQMRELNFKEYNSTFYENIKIDDAHRMVRIDRMELWKAVNSKKEVVVKNFPLRDF